MRVPEVPPYRGEKEKMYLRRRKGKSNMATNRRVPPPIKTSIFHLILVAANISIYLYSSEKDQKNATDSRNVAQDRKDLAVR